MAVAEDTPNLAREVKLRLEVNSENAFSWIETQGTASEVCELYGQAVKDLYWLDKGAKSLVVIGSRGVSFCLEQAIKFVDSEPTMANGFKAQAKTIAYNVAANTWPGWGDEGVIISKSETEAGLEAAKLNLKLAEELKKPSDKIAAAYWLLSAMQLALDKFQESIASIDLSNIYASQAGDKTVLAYNEGFKGLIFLASGNITGTEPFDSGVRKLKEIGSEDATFYVSQLATGKKIFVK